MHFFFKITTFFFILWSKFYLASSSTMFTKYEKMPESLTKLDLPKQLWVVTEKIHGANFAFIIDSNSVYYAKRTGLLNWDDDFFGFQLVAEKHFLQAQQIFKNLQQSFKIIRCTIYGELFGGQYPHPKVAPDTRVSAIQTGVYYAPSIEFCAFDIAIETIDNQAITRHYLDYETVINHCQKVHLPYAKPLLIAPLNEASDFNTKINSTIPVLLGLPPLQDNIMEGVVLKPFKASTVRAIFKIKNEQFKEDKFHQAQKWHFHNTQNIDIQDFISMFKTYINQNRLNAVLSKTGRFSKNPSFEQLSYIKNLFLEDAMESFTEDFKELLTDLSPVDWNALKTAALVTISDLLN
jgi:Rnl2 family RNA ligase